MVQSLSKDRPVRDLLVLSIFSILILFAFWRSIPKQFQGNQNYDYTCCYEPSARDWMNGRGLIYPNGKFATNYPPGYPAVLVVQFTVAKAIGDGPAFVLVTILCDLATVFGVYAAGRTVGGFWVGRLAGLALISYPFFLWLSKQPNSEVPFFPFFVWAFYCYLRLTQERETRKVWMWAALTGALWGLATLVRPIALFAPIVTGGCYLVSSTSQVVSKRLAAVCFMIACSAATLMPWEVIVHHELGRWVLLTTNAGIAYTNGTATPEGVAHSLAEEVTKHPGEFVKLILVKSLRVWYATHEGFYESANKVVSSVYLVAAALGLWMMRRSMRCAALGILAMTCYFEAMAMLVLPILRYMIPAFVLMMLAVAVLLKGLMDRWLPGGSIAEIKFGM